MATVTTSINSVNGGVLISWAAPVSNGG
jgi:hypothetical protein